MRLEPDFFESIRQLVQSARFINRISVELVSQ